MGIRHRIRSITSHAGEKIDFPATGVICVVGGNNAGKSQLLRDIGMSVKDHDAAPLTFSDIEAERPSASEEETLAWLLANAQQTEKVPGKVPTFVPRSKGMQENGTDVRQFVRWYDQERAYLGIIAEFFIEHTPAGALARYATGSISSESYSSSRNTPLAALYANGELEAELSGLSEQTFGVPLTLDRVGVRIRLRVGSVGVPVPPINRPSPEYVDAVSSLPTFDSQGDGVKSFVGLAVHVMTQSTDIMLFDEPEAFLHPGQSRALGRWLASAAVKYDRQIFVATHDRDFVLGLLEAPDNPPLSVVRISRASDDSQIAQLRPEQVRAIWDDPVFRYSNVLQGLFHKKVFVCESDGDCRFYGAAMDELAVTRGVRATSDDTLFVPSGGKPRVPSLLNALSALGVEAAAIVDFDVLRRKADLKGIVTAVRSPWTQSMDANYSAFANAVNAANAQGRDIWVGMKSSGLADVPIGAPYAAADALLRELVSVGVHVVPVGELEGFNRSESMHGAAWVSSALEGHVHKSEAVEKFVAPMLEGVPPLS